MTLITLIDPAEMQVQKAWSMSSYSLWLGKGQQHSLLNQRYSASSVMGILSLNVSEVLKVERVIKGIFIENEERHWVSCLFIPTDFLISLYSYSDSLLCVYSENSVSILLSASHCSAVNTCHQVALSSVSNPQQCPRTTVTPRLVSHLASGRVLFVHKI